MTRRELLLTMSAGVYAQGRIPSFVYRDYPRCLPDYLTGLASASRSKRITAIANLKTPAAVKQRQRWVRETLVRLIGGLPEKTELKVRQTGTLAREGYRLEKVVYESRPKFYVSANLYVPTKGVGPFPGVLFQLGHSDNGKAYGPYQSACQGLARLGFLVLAFDPMGQGERIYYPDATFSRSRLADADAEHTNPGRQMLLVGTTCTQFQLWDAIRSLDYLAAHPLVDPKRIASVGQSGGATLSMLLGAVDDRLAVIAEFSGNTENIACQRFLPPGSTDDAEQNLVGAGPLGFDRWDLFYPFAPKPLLISISDKDSFGTYSPNYVLDSSEEFERLAAIYKLFDAARNLRWTDTPLPHGLSHDSRLQLYNWLRLHLQGVREPLTAEPTIALEHEKDLWVSESGSLLKSFGRETPLSITQKRYAAKRYAAISTAASDAPLRKLLQLEEPSPATASILKQVPAPNGVSIAALDVPSVTKVTLPAWLFRKQGTPKEAPAILVLDARGRNATWHEDGLGQMLAAQGCTVCCADVRGVGDLAPQFSAGSPGYARPHQESENYAWSSLILGRPLVGQRVTDILALLRSLRSLTGQKEIALAASGELTVPALFAAALDPAVSALYLAGGLSSFADVLRTENYTHPLVNFVPGLLQHTDLPEIAAQLKPRRVVLAGSVNGAGETLAPAAVSEAYGIALADGHLRVEPNARWDAATLARFLFQRPEA